MARGGFDLDPYKAIEKWNNRAVATNSNDDEMRNYVATSSNDNKL